LGLRTENEDFFVENETGGTFERIILRPSELVRCVNNTGLGDVLSRRQLYRHREQAPWIHAGKKRINFVAYLAWLVHRRHARPKRKCRKNSVCDVLNTFDLWAKLEDQNFRCALTGELLTPTNFSLDHIVPISEGGNLTAENSQLVLKTANRAKNTMSQTEFIDMCRKVAAFHSTSTESSSKRKSNEN
jgi:5-methylcytosine-specific restriction endonuclease McrA